MKTLCLDQLYFAYKPLTTVEAISVLPTWMSTKCKKKTKKGQLNEEIHDLKRNTKKTLNKYKTSI